MKLNLVVFTTVILVLNFVNGWFRSKPSNVDDWNESQLKEFLLENDIVAPDSSLNDLRELTKELVKEIEASASSVTSSIPKPTTFTALNYVYDSLLNDLNDSKDFIYSNWSDNQLRSYLENKGIIRSKSQLKRDELLSYMRKHYAEVTEPIYEAWSDNYIKRWLINNNIIESNTARNRDQLVKYMKDNYYDTKSYVYSTWSNNELKSWLIKNGYLKSKEEKTRDELLNLLDKYYTKSREVVISSWNDVDLHKWAVNNGLIKSDAEVKRQQLEKIAHEKYDKLTSVAQPYIAWSDARLRGWLRSHAPDAAKVAKTRNELISQVRKHYVDVQGYSEVVIENVKQTLYKGYQLLEHKLNNVYNLINGNVNKASDHLQSKADQFQSKADQLRQDADKAASSASSLASKATQGAKQEL